MECCEVFCRGGAEAGADVEDPFVPGAIANPPFGIGTGELTLLVDEGDEADVPVPDARTLQGGKAGESAVEDDAVDEAVTGRIPIVVVGGGGGRAGVW